ncbi:MAG: hypothetical protein IJQ81_17975 [Oscillibacter sp.]|nr:hypothetical protein [Oscillibacter sp.]
MLDAILVGAYIGVCVAASAAGFFKCELYQDWKAEQEPAVVYTFGDPAALTSADATDAPDIVIVTD